MNDAEIIKRIEQAGLTLRLLEDNGRIDGLEGKGKENGWYDLCKEMGVDEFTVHHAYRVAYENGWHEGFDQRGKKDD